MKNDERSANKRHFYTLIAKLFYFNKIELTNAPSCGIMFVLQKKQRIFRGVAKVTSKKQLIVVFYEVKPPKARSEPSRRLAQATDHDYATVAEGERHAICSSVIFFRGVAKVVSRQFRVLETVGSSPAASTKKTVF